MRMRPLTALLRCSDLTHARAGTPSASPDRSNAYVDLVWKASVATARADGEVRGAPDPGNGRGVRCRKRDGADWGHD
jgi:hypothetical protein